MECTFIVLEYDSAFGYEWHWNTNGEKERLESPVHGYDACLYSRIRVRPGQFLFHDRYNYDSKGLAQNFSALVRVPESEERFRAFCTASACASEAVYERILGYKQGSRFGGGPYDYTNDFPGTWLDPFIVQAWRNDSAAPANLQEALARLTEKR